LHVLSRVIWEECVVTSHVGECTLPLHVLAVQCAMLQNIMGALQNVARSYGNFTECYWTLRKRYMTLENVTKSWVS